MSILVQPKENYRRDGLQRKAEQFGETDALYEEIDTDHWQLLSAAPKDSPVVVQPCPAWLFYAPS